MKATERFFDNLAQFNSGNGSPTETVVTTYDAFGRRVSAVRHQGDDTGTVTRTETWSYTDQGQLASTTTPEGTISYTYDSLGRQATTSTSSVPVR